ncbi:MAG: hypothetical protein DIZ80_07975 [endosymbiont of Galathealinum brachiosum]|uniref:Uncharacterized protein n=1 Tax=endosymbiont of Galathealinum brachiosum TaxID=2200906 RepID=A0A370DGQ4_9GAMM|nr:MAG: hypothetical protein DIZ80_07975 [endosymbiont of Galathealinum brachiosum]
MIEMKLKLVIIFILFNMLSACASKPDKIQPFWMEKANDYAANGVLLYEQQLYKESVVSFSRAYNAYQRFDYVKGISNSLLNLSKAEIARHNVTEAEIHLKELDVLIEEYDFNIISIHVDIIRSSISINKIELNKAENILNKYIDSLGGNIQSIQKNLYIALLTNRVRLAVKSNYDSEYWVKIYASKTDKNNARLLRFNAQMAGIKNDLNVVNQLFSGAMEIYREQANSKSVLSTLKEWGETLRGMNQLNAAAKRYETAYKVAKSASVKFEENIIINKLLEIYELQSDSENIRRLKKLQSS